MSWPSASCPATRGTTSCCPTGCASTTCRPRRRRCATKRGSTATTALRGKYPRGRGISVLLSGPSGTGKTMAAEVIANDLGLDLYRIDLSRVVSKYIGETEKNLRAVFDAAEASGAVLLFDEADALFGKRSEVKDSHDRYANIEVSYLLQRMESYAGLAILATNMKSHLDAAFLRRLRYVVDVPFPDATARRLIWQKSIPGRNALRRPRFRRACAARHRRRQYRRHRGQCGVSCGRGRAASRHAPPRTGDPRRVSQARPRIAAQLARSGVIMADPPPVKTSGAGSNAQAARLGADIGAGTARALAGYRGPALRIDTLRLRLPEGAGSAQIERAVRDAIARKTRGT